MRHFRYDRGLVRRKTQRDPEREAKDARQDGFYSYTEFRLVPIQDIVPEAVWHPSRIKHIREGIAEKAALPPIELSQDAAGKYHISDGIHRYNASLEAGYTHVPAFVSVLVEVPEAQEAELPERPKQRVGDAVLLREPKASGADSPWAIIEQVLYESRHRGVKRHHYALVGLRKGEAEFIGDHRDDQLDIPKGSPPEGLLKLFQEYDMWPTGVSPIRVARRYLGQEI